MTNLPQWSRRVVALGRGENYVRILPRLGFKWTTGAFTLAYDWHFGWSFRWRK